MDVNKAMTNQTIWNFAGFELRRNGECRAPKADEFFLRRDGNPCLAVCDFRDKVVNRFEILVPVRFKTHKCKTVEEVTA